MLLDSYNALTRHIALIFFSPNYKQGGKLCQNIDI